MKKSEKSSPIGSDEHRSSDSEVGTIAIKNNTVYTAKSNMESFSFINKIVGDNSGNRHQAIGSSSVANSKSLNMLKYDSFIN